VDVYIIDVIYIAWIKSLCFFFTNQVIWTIRTIWVFFMIQFCTIMSVIINNLMSIFFYFQNYDVIDNRKEDNNGFKESKTRTTILYTTSECTNTFRKFCTIFVQKWKQKCSFFY
jgi:hypothetical protein